MTIEESKALPPGIYRIHWKRGKGSSLAAVGVTDNGGRWLAPINWTMGSAAKTVWSDVERADRVWFP